MVHPGDIAHADGTDLGAAATDVTAQGGRALAAPRATATAVIQGAKACMSDLLASARYCNNLALRANAAAAATSNISRLRTMARRTVPSLGARRPRRTACPCAVATGDVPRPSPGGPYAGPPDLPGGCTVPGARSHAGRTAVVTGASSGIGRAIAERLGADGAHVVLGGRTESAMKASAARIEASGGAATVVVGDVREPGVVQGLIDVAVGETGRLDVLVNNAGIADFGPILGGDVEHWRAMFDTNVVALLAGCQAGVQAMRAKGTAGHIVNISSVAAQDPSSGVYGATKHAVNVISRTLRLELLDDPIKVTTVMPGVVATNMARALDPSVLAAIVALSGLDIDVTPGERVPDEVLERAQVALSDFAAKPEDVADAVAFAISQPPGVHVAEIVVRPNKDLQLS